MSNACYKIINDKFDSQVLLQTFSNAQLVIHARTFVFER